MCLYPKLIFNKKYLSNNKNGGNVPPVIDYRTLYVPIGCGKCIECCKQKSNNWKIRLIEELKENRNAYFVHFTFSNESLIKITSKIDKLCPTKILENEIATYAVRHFLELWRKDFKKSLKHWLITELGQTSTERVHLHGIIWSDYPDMLGDYWRYGFMDIGQYVNEETIGYIVKYITKIDTKHKGYKPKILCSPGIGKYYLKRGDHKRNQYRGLETNETYKSPSGLKHNLPIYYRNAIYTEQEREKLWLTKLDKQERWVMGEQIDISETENNYDSTLKYYQRKNKRLGYGDNTEDWSIKAYKKQRKNMNKRIHTHNNKNKN